MYVLAFWVLIVALGVAAYLVCRNPPELREGLHEVQRLAAPERRKVMRMPERPEDAFGTRLWS
jgi:hypothetical protein